MLTIHELNGMKREQFAAALGWVFEQSPWVAERAFAARPFASREALHRAMVEQMEQAAAAEQRDLLCAHSDLGARSQISAASAREQSVAGLDRLTVEEYYGFQELNRAYRTKFGIPFLYAVKGSTKEDIFEALLARLDSSPDEEFRQALTEVSRIAWFRIESAILD